MAQTRMLEVEAERSGKILDIFLRVESKAFLLSGGRDLKDDSKVFELITWRDGFSITWDGEDYVWNVCRD